MHEKIAIFTALFTLQIFCVTGGVLALTPEEAATRLFQADEVPRDWFASHGLGSAVPRVIADVRAALGELKAVEPCAETCIALFERGELGFEITVDDEGLITGLLIEPPIVYASSLEDAVERFRELDGDVSLLVTRNGETVSDLRGGEPMAVGSAFKLAVLKALDNLIGAGKLDWDQVVGIRDRWRSLPSGSLQDWPTGAPITLHTLASQMISVSDNTAADALIDIVTRNSVETISPRNRPFLTTREFFQLKHRGHERERTAYAVGNFDQRMAILNGFSALPVPRISELITDPLLRFEWHFSTRELCSLIGDLQSLDVLQINPGIARKRDWESIAFKGGSDFGALNLTTGLVDDRGTTYCVSATWNDDQALDLPSFSALYTSVLHQLSSAP